MLTNGRLLGERAKRLRELLDFPLAKVVLLKVAEPPTYRRIGLGRASKAARVA